MQLLCSGQLLCEQIYYASAYLPFIFAAVIPITLFIAGRKRQAFLAAIAIVSSVIISEGLKYVFNIPRPFFPLDSPSFPSSHSSVAFSEARILKFNKIFFILGLLFAVFTAFGRVYTGFHTWQDVIAGGVLGFIISEIIMREGSHFIHGKEKSGKK